MIDTSHGPITDIHYTPTGLLILTNTGLLLRDSTHGRDHNIELVATGVSCVDGCGGMVAMGNQEGLITLVSGNTQEVSLITIIIVCVIFTIVYSRL